MIIYNVTIKVERESAAEWVKWMQEEHMPEVIATGCFDASRLSHLLDQDEQEGVTYVAQYFCDNIEQYHKYIDEHAMGLREKGLKAFGAKFAAFRTVMEVL